MNEVKKQKKIKWFVDYVKSFSKHLEYYQNLFTPHFQWWLIVIDENSLKLIKCVMKSMFMLILCKEIKSITIYCNDDIWWGKTLRNLNILFIKSHHFVIKNWNEFEYLRSSSNVLNPLPIINIDSKSSSVIKC